MTEPGAHRMLVEKTAHYYSLGEAGEHVRYLWIVCHGYGQLARKFIRKFDFADPKEHFVLAPEGLSRFYWNGFSGEPVASWMTRENRLDEIRDYSVFLSSLYDSYKSRCPQAKVILFGFSQGVATQLRWMFRDFPDFDHLILYAGSLPEDLDYRTNSAYLSQGKVHLWYGTEDEFITPEVLSRNEDLIRNNTLEVGLRSFSGRHQVDRKVVSELFSALIS